MTPHLYLLTAVVVWGLEFPIFRECTRAVGFLVTGTVMFVIAAVLLGLTRLLKGPLLNDEAIAARRPIPYKRLLLIGLIGFSANGVAIAASQLTSVINVSALGRTDVLFSLALSVLIFREKVAKWAFFSLPIMAVGVCILTGIITESPELGKTGDYLMLFSAFLIALNAFVIKGALRDVRPLGVGATNTAVTAVCFIITTLVAYRSIDAFRDVSRETWIMLGALGVMAYIFFITYNMALKSVPVWEVRLFCLSIPVVATLAAWAWLGKRPSGLQCLGMCLIAAGATGAIVSRIPRRAKPVDQGGSR